MNSIALTLFIIIMLAKVPQEMMDKFVSDTWHINNHCINPAILMCKICICLKDHMTVENCTLVYIFQ